MAGSELAAKKKSFRGSCLVVFLLSWSKSFETGAWPSKWTFYQSDRRVLKKLNKSSLQWNVTTRPSRAKVSHHSLSAAFVMDIPGPRSSLTTEMYWCTRPNWSWKRENAYAWTRFASIHVYTVKCLGLIVLFLMTAVIQFNSIFNLIN